MPIKLSKLIKRVKAAPEQDGAHDKWEDQLLKVRKEFDKLESIKAPDMEMEKEYKTLISAWKKFAEAWYG